MAVSNLSVTDVFDSVLTTTMRAYRKKLISQTEQKIPFLMWLERKGKRIQRGGTKISIPVLYRESNATGQYKGYDIFDVTPQEGITRVEYPWASTYASISISGDDETTNDGEQALLDLLKVRTQQAEMTIRARLNDALHGVFGYGGYTTGDGVTAGSGRDAVGNSSVLDDGKQYMSLDNYVRMPWGYIDPTGGAITHRVGGLNVVMTGAGGGAITDFATLTVSAETNTWWLNYSNPGFGRFDRRNTDLGPALSGVEIDYAANITDDSNRNIVGALRAMYKRCSGPHGKPDVGLTSEEVLSIYEAGMVPLERFTDTEVGDLGFQNVVYKGMTILEDPGITGALPTTIDPTTAAGRPVPLYLLNSDTFEWVVHPKRDFHQTPFFRPHNQDARTSQILLKAQLVCNHRQANGVIACGAETNGYDQ